MARRIYITFCAIAAFACFNTTTVLGAGVISVPFVPAGLSFGDTYQIAFVTAGVTDATSPDKSYYDAFVADEADASGALTETWGIGWSAIVASLNDPDAKGNAGISAPVYLLDGTYIAADAVDFWDGFHEAGMDVDQFGLASGGGALGTVWTGIHDPTGGVVTTTHSLGYASSGAYVGTATISDGGWSTGGIEPNLGNMRAIYAVSETLTVIPEPTTFGTCVLMSGVGAMFGFGRRKRECPTIPLRA